MATNQFLRASRLRLAQTTPADSFMPERALLAISRRQMAKMPPRTTHDQSKELGKVITKVRRVKRRVKAKTLHLHLKGANRFDWEYTAFQLPVYGTPLYLHMIPPVLKVRYVTNCKPIQDSPSTRRLFPISAMICCNRWRTTAHVSPSAGHR